jgi:hypothetical protein
MIVAETVRCHRSDSGPPSVHQCSHFPVHWPARKRDTARRPALLSNIVCDELDWELERRDRPRHFA